MDLAGRKILVTGVATRQSIGYAVAREAQLAGAEVLLTSFGRVRKLTERTARTLPEPVDVLELDVSRPEDFAALTGELESRWGHVDGALHSVAFAPDDALGGDFLTTPAESAETAFRVSAFSLKGLGEALVPLFPPSGGSIVGLDFDAQVAWPAYDWMGVAKAALESVTRYLARDLGGRGVRVNLVAAGPLRTLALSGIPGAHALEEAWAERAPLGWDGRDPVPVAQAVCFLLSDWARAITGEILHVDGGFHALGVALPQADEAAAEPAAAPDAEPVPEVVA
ncbi:MAG TPA: enoyl-ACP reductase FabI [Thermoleophilaceae bacterium]